MTRGVGRKATKNQLDRWEPRVRAHGAAHADFTQKDVMRVELQGTRSLIFTGLVERGVIEQAGHTGRAARTKLYRLTGPGPS